MAVLSGVVDRLVISDRRRNVRNFGSGQPRKQSVELFVTHGRRWKIQERESEKSRFYLSYGLSVNKEADIANGQVDPPQRYVIIEEDVDLIEHSLGCFGEHIKQAGKAEICLRCSS